MESGSGPGESMMGPLGVIVLVLLIVAAAICGTIALMQIWPPASTFKSQNYVLFGASVTLTSDVDLLVIAGLSGAIGGMIHSLRSVAWYVGNRSLRWSWMAMYATLPIVGGLLGILFYFVLRAGLVTGGASSVSPFGVAAVAALVGMFTTQAAEMLLRIFSVIFSKAAPGADHMPAKDVTGS